MKSKANLFLLTCTTVALSLFHTSSLAQVFDLADVTMNRAIAASPRAVEAFPQLSRSGAKLGETAARSASNSLLAEVVRNRAVANSPRVLEQFPELLRPAPSAKKAGGSLPGSPVVKARAMVASPRTLEEFPWLARREPVDDN